VVESFGAGAVELDVVGGPPDPEVVAARRKLTDEVGEALVVWVASGGGAQDRDSVVRDVVPVLENSGAFGLRNKNRAMLTGRDGKSNTGE
jgi:hypothetical protein